MTITANSDKFFPHLSHFHHRLPTGYRQATDWLPTGYRQATDSRLTITDKLPTGERRSADKSPPIKRNGKQKAKSKEKAVYMKTTEKPSTLGSVLFTPVTKSLMIFELHVIFEMEGTCSKLQGALLLCKRLLKGYKKLGLFLSPDRNKRA